MSNDISITNIEGYTITLDKSTTTISLQSQGPQGKSATVSVGNVTTLEPNELVNITNSGTQYDAILNFSIPKGDKGDKGDIGDTPLIEIGSVETLPYDQNATVENVGTTTDAILNFGIPRGDIPDVTVGTVTTLPAGFNATVENVGTAEEAILNFGIPKGYDGTGATEGSTGYNANLHYTPLASDVSGYLQLSYDVYPTETEYSNTIKNQELLLRSYLYPSQLGVTSIDSGTWSFTFTSKVSSATRDTQFKAEVFLRHIDNTETTLFGVYSSFIDNTVYQAFKVESSQQAFTCLPTDRLGVRVYGKTTSNSNVVLYIIVGDGRGGYFSTPLKIRHSQLRGLNEDSSFQHITVTDKASYDSAVILANNSADKDLSNISDIAKGMLKTIGEIIPVMATSSYVPNGCLPCDGAEYSFSQFSSLVTNYLTSSPAKLLTCTYTDYATSITTYGQCPKFAIDTTNQKFKTPTLKDGSFIQQAKSDSELGKSYNAGLPNITGNFAFEKNGYGDAGVQVSGPFTISTTSGNPEGGGAINAGRNAKVTFNASLSNSIYGASSTVQPNAVALRYFVVVANGTVNQSQMDWSNYMSGLAGKANNTLDNLSSPGKIAIAHNAMPSSSYIDLTLGASGSTYTAPADGWMYIDKILTVANQYFALGNANSSISGEYSVTSPFAGTHTTLLMPVKRGDLITYTYTVNGATVYFRFIYAEGSKV